MPLNIGLIGATAIAERAIVRPSTDRDDVRVRAVAASDLGRAAKFASRNAIAQVHPDYTALLDDPYIDTVYISLHNSAHCHWAVRALRSGLHVVVEKPLCLSAAETCELQQTAADHGGHVVEAVPTIGHPWHAAVRDMIGERTYGRLRSVRTRIRFPTPAPGSYRDRPDLGGGIFRDCASYWMQALQATVGLEGVRGRGGSAFDGPNMVDRDFSARIDWPCGIDATLRCEVGEGLTARHEFVFDQAEVRLKNFLLPIAGAVPLNITVARPDGTRHVMGFPAWSYYERQLDRIEAELAEPTSPRGGAKTTDDRGNDGGLGPAGERIELMDRLYQSADKLA